MIASGIILVWGAAVLVYAISSGLSGSGSYAGGQLAATVFAAVMVFAGARGIRKELRRRT